MCLFVMNYSFKQQEEHAPSFSQQNENIVQCDAIEQERIQSFGTNSCYHMFRYCLKASKKGKQRTDLDALVFNSDSGHGSVLACSLHRMPPIIDCNIDINDGGAVVG